ncbi:hypothetical protein [Mameliella alba]|uniref:hypothetical protein n=1 Tax=Mameliella alba TaxID=561184 RepID=UPI000B533637|nr:hypothetical protein [Mameliella alba]OWV43184.1 hypothetical protein CDZ95_10345 [Mameliella alba]
MAFRIAEERTITRTVQTADGQDFRAVFVILPDEEMGAASAGGIEGEKAVMRKIIRRLDDIEGADKKPIPHSPELLEQVIGFADLRIALLRAYNEGRIEARQGN